MKLVPRPDGAFVADVSAEELVILNNALNEVCNGVGIAEEEFQTRLGASRAEAIAVLRVMQRALETRS